ncbi:MAG: hypothetical protein QW343_01935 [Candidatus Norongarragalinales archaeon]
MRSLHYALRARNAVPRRFARAKTKFAEFLGKKLARIGFANAQEIEGGVRLALNTNAGFDYAQAKALAQEFQKRLEKIGVSIRVVEKQPEKPAMRLPTKPTAAPVTKPAKEPKPLTDEEKEQLLEKARLLKQKNKNHETRQPHNNFVFRRNTHRFLALVF